MWSSDRRDVAVLPAVMTPTGRTAPPPPDDVAAVFGAALPAAEVYAELLATAGVERGLLGPREIDRLWDRHVLNSAVLAECVPIGAGVLDVGSGAGLPGVPLALVRPDLHVTLLEPMARRCAFLEEVVDTVGLGARVDVCHGRAEALVQEDRTFDVVTARAVAPTRRLVALCLPLLTPAGTLLALKGRTAAAEVAEAQDVLARLRARADVLDVGPPGYRATVIRVTRVGRPTSSRRGRR